ncbi:cell division cycle 20-like protein 1, cofactor of APC complex [Pancytospora philotis]|nr:cell division cycle 20-like protein 1, cofactor of APC complex [Pancytospora philotis]
MLYGDDCPVISPFVCPDLYGARGRRGAPRPEVVQTAMRTIQCDDISDDFYSNLLDWSREIVYYADGNTVYGYNFHSTARQKLFSMPGTHITAVKYNPTSRVLCIGTGDGGLVLADPLVQKYEQFSCHRARIGALEVLGSSIITGSRDRRARIFDLRSRSSVAVFASHFQEVCGLSANDSSSHLASGGNDNRVFIYDIRASTKPISRLKEHRAAIKAISWAPGSSSQLLTGGGTADKTIRLWDLSLPALLVRAQPFDSQVCNLRWLRDNTVLATFGYSNDDVKLLSDLRIVRQYVGHRNRVLHFAVDDDEQFFATGSSDSTLRIWSLDARREAEDIRIR